MRLGFPVKLLGAPELKSHDARRWQSGPHLEVSLAALDRVLDWLDAHDIRMYRMSSDLAPYATHPDLPQFHGMIAQCDARLAAVGAKARHLGIRLSFHPSQYVVINSPDPVLVTKSVADLAAQSEMLDRMRLGPEAVVVLHVGGVYEDRAISLRRWIDNWGRLPEHVRRRLVLEHDDLRFSAADTLAVHEATGVRLVFDHQHFRCLNPERLALRPTLERMLATWQPSGARPKIHFSSPRTGLVPTRRRNPATGRMCNAVKLPLASAHADLVDPFELAAFLRDAAAGLDFDLMLEAKAKDLALVRLRDQLVRYAPDVARRIVGAPAVAEHADDEVVVDAAAGDGE